MSETEKADLKCPAAVLHRTVSVSLLRFGPEEEFYAKI